MTRFRASDGLDLFFADEGEGPPVLFLHGWMMSHVFFRRQFGDLARDHRCLALDLRGCGDSENRPGTHAIDRYADDALDLLDHLEVADATVVGWSLGGAVAVRALQKDPRRRIARIGLVDFPPRLSEDPGMAERVCAKLSTDRDAFMTRFLKRMFFEEPRTEDLAWMMAVNAKCASDTGCEMYRQLDKGVVDAVRDVPAFLAFPGHGWFHAALADWQRLFPRHTAPRFERSRHCPFLEESDRFNLALRAFVRDPEPTAAGPGPGVGEPARP